MVSGGCKGPGGFGELFDHGQEESTWGRARVGVLCRSFVRAAGGGPSSNFCVPPRQPLTYLSWPRTTNIIVCTFACFRYATL